VAVAGFDVLVEFARAYIKCAVASACAVWSMTANWVAQSRRREQESREVSHRSTAPPTKLYVAFVGPAVMDVIVRVVFAATMRTA
jgi:hypothetical protein